jgi:hypothetical protein
LPAAPQPPGPCTGVNEVAAYKSATLPRVTLPVRPYREVSEHLRE